ncbi:unnamed protein product [Hydatigera taeniaeformis]|uniref:DNA_pol_B_exo1 domain-containing protein n=1 Tax=Hydatigena taeniaeformis TaxID=6205 RepID=A0A0R3WPT9_HYDTA|nr:unnamed protein product [Hydatigera taeniaeformis]
MHQSQSEEDLEVKLLDNAKASVSTLLYPDEIDGIDGNGMLENMEERQDDDLFASILDSSVSSEPFFNENFVENSAESTSALTVRESTSLHLPQVDGADDTRAKRVNRRTRRRRLGLRLMPRHTHSLVSSPHSSSINSASEAKLSTPLRERRNNMTYIIDNDDVEEGEDVDSSLVLRFPPEASQVLEDEAQNVEAIKPLPCHLGDTDFALHSSVYLTLRDPPAPPSYCQVEAEMNLLKTDSPQPVTVSAPSADKLEIDLSASLSILWSQEEHQRRMNSCTGNSRLISSSSSSSSNPIGRRAFLPVQVRENCYLDFSCRIDFLTIADLQLVLLMVEVAKRHYKSSADCDKACDMRTGYFTKIQENHCTLASLEVLCHIRRQAGSPTAIHRTSQAISISSLGGFFAPNPQLDCILAASLAFSSSVSPTYLLVVVEPQKPPLSLPISHRRSTLPALIICNSEIDLLNWIIYLIQSFDPDILLGYDVERWSWNYVVQRAARIGRVGFLRDISRLAPEHLSCPFCLDCMSKCSGLVPGDRLFVSSVSSSCSCNADVGSSRTRPSFSAWPCEPGRGRSDAPFACPGRLVFSLWHLLKYEVCLHFLPHCPEISIFDHRKVYCFALDLKFCCF